MVPLQRKYHPQGIVNSIHFWQLNFHRWTIVQQDNMALNVCAYKHIADKDLEWKSEHQMSVKDKTDMYYKLKKPIQNHELHT
jgi:hypothetical protein